MTVRRDEYFERYREFTTREGWTEEQQLFVARIAIVGYGSSEVLERMTKEIVKIQKNIKETEFEQSLEASEEEAQEYAQAYIRNRFNKPV